jgi:uncharacterized membrane protein
VKVLGVIVVIALVGGLTFALLNQDVVMEVRGVRVPGGTYTIPVLGSVLIASMAVILLMFLVSRIEEAFRRRALSRALARLAQREHEIAEMKSRAYDDVSEKLDALRDEIVTRLPTPTRIPDTGVPDEERTPVGPGVSG